MSERFVVLGLAPVRSDWFRAVGSWSNEAAIPVEFVKCVSTTEVLARLESLRPFSALLVDALTPGLDRDLLDAAASHGCAAIIVDPGLTSRDWRELGAVAVVSDRIDATELMATLDTVAQRIGRAAESPPPPSPGVNMGTDTKVVTVTGSGGMGTSTIAMAITQGLASVPARRRVVLADMALRSSQAQMHDARDVVPGLTELVESHRLGIPEMKEVASTIHDLPDRGYHLVLGLRHERDWMSINGRALEATWRSLATHYRTVVAEVTGDLDGTEETGAHDLEDRNRLARTAVRRADLVVVVGAPGLWGIQRLIRSVISTTELGVSTERILLCINRGPRQPKTKAAISSAVAELLHSRISEAGQLASPVFVPERRNLDSVHADGAQLPTQLAAPISAAVGAMLDRGDADRSEVTGEREREPVAITPGSLQTWSDDD